MAWSFVRCLELNVVMTTHTPTPMNGPRGSHILYVFLYLTVLFPSARLAISLVHE